MSMAKRSLRWLCGCVLFCSPLLAQAQVAPAVTQVSFVPASVASGVNSQLTIVLGNSNATPATLTAALNDAFPPGLTLANATVGGSCTAGAVVARMGAANLIYSAGGSIPSGGCSITVAVRATSAKGNTYFSDSIPAGSLITNFGASTSGASGTLTVRAAVTVPSLIGLTQTQAATALQGAGLVLGTVTKGFSTVALYSVASQSPAANAAAAAGSAVNIVVSAGSSAVGNPNSPLSTAPGTNRAQISVASALERICAELAQLNPANATMRQQNLFANCRGIIATYGGGNNAAGLENTLNAVSGRQTTAQQQTGILFAGTQFTNIGARLAQLRQGTSGLSASGLDLGLPGGMPLGALLASLQDPSNSGFSAPPMDILGDGGIVGGGAGDASPGTPSRFGFFVNGSLRRGTQDTTNYESGFDFKNNGVTAGVDYRFTDKFVLGIAGGHSSGSSDFAGASARLDSRSNSGSIYGSYYNRDLYVDAIATFAHIGYTSDRTTSFSVNEGSVIAPNCAGSDCAVDVSGSTTARQYAFGTSLGYSFHRGGLVFGPDVALDYTRIQVNGFSESDPTLSGMALSYGDETGESLILKAGGHLSYVISTPVGVIIPQVRARYDHEFKNDQTGLNAHFVVDPTVNSPNGPISNFVVLTDAPDRSYFDWAAGVSAQFAYGISAFIDYSAVADQDNLTTHQLAFGVRFQYLVR